MIKKIPYISVVILVLFILSGCNQQQVGNVINNLRNSVIKVTAPKSVATKLNQPINATIIFSAPAGVTFNSFRITSGLNPLPPGWSSAVNTFSCPTVTNGNGCSLTLTFNPTDKSQKGTLTLNFSYASGFGSFTKQNTGSVNIPYFVSSSTIHVPATQFGVLNNCPYKVWFQSIDGSGLNAPIVGLNKGESYDYAINGQFVNSFRVWPKTGCDESGNNCTIGQSSNPCPSGGNGCAPPIDSKFEGTFNAPGNSNVTSYDGSLVDGFTLPFSIRVTKAANETNSSCLDVEASNINYATSCPTTENLSTPYPQMLAAFGSTYAFGGYNTYGTPPVSLTSVNLMVINPNNGQQAGCYSPTTKLTYPNNTPGWGGAGIGQGGTGNPAYYNQAIMYSCAFTTSQLTNGTAPNLPSSPDNQGFLNLSGFCKSVPGQNCNDGVPNGPAAHDICGLGPVPNTQYVNYVHANTHNLYAFAYDDTNGNLSCNESATKIAFITCPE